MDKNSMFRLLSAEVDKSLQDRDTVMRLYGLSAENADKEIADYGIVRTSAEQGSPQSREYLLGLYSRILMHLGYGDPNKINELIDFNNLLNNPDNVLLEALLVAKDLTEYLKDYNIGIEESADDGDEPYTDEEMNALFPEDHPTEYPENFSSAKLREVVTAELHNLNLVFSNTHNRLRLLAILLYAPVYGYDIIDSLLHQKITEVGYRDRNYIYVIYKGIKIWVSFLQFSDKDKLISLQKKSSSLSKLQYQESNPSLVTAKSTGNRVTVVGYALTPDDTAYYNERIFNIEKITLEQMRDQFNTINQWMFNFIVLNQRARGKYIVSGADMGVGKTTMFVAMLGKVPRKWGVGLLDPQNEMQIEKKFPDINVKPLVESKERTIAESFEIMLKQARDILAVSEIAGAEEFSELMKAAKRLNSGVGATMHNGSLEDIVPNCAQLALEVGSYNDRESAERGIAEALDLGFHMVKLRGGRIIVDGIAEFLPVSNDFYVDPESLVLGKDKPFQEKLDMLVELGQRYLAKKLYNKPYRVNMLVKYNRATDEWDVVGRPSDEYMRRAALQLTNREYATLERLFAGVSANG